MCVSDPCPRVTKAHAVPQELAASQSVGLSPISLMRICGTDLHVQLGSGKGLLWMVGDRD